MSPNDSTARSLDSAIENFAAELTEAAFPVALRYGVIGSSVDLKVEVWRKLTETLKKLPRELLMLVGHPKSNSCEASK